MSSKLLLAILTPVYIAIIATTFIRSAQAQVAVSPNDLILHVFGGANDGSGTAGGVVIDHAGNLYGTTSHGGTGTLCLGGSCGTVYKLSPPGKSGGQWTESILYDFMGVLVNQDGALPNGGVILGANGNLLRRDCLWWNWTVCAVRRGARLWNSL